MQLGLGIHNEENEAILRLKFYDDKIEPYLKIVF